MPDLGSLNQTPQELAFGTLHMEVYKIPPELAAKYIPPNRLGQGCGPWVQVLGQEPVVGQGAYFKSRGYSYNAVLMHSSRVVHQYSII